MGYDTHLAPYRFKKGQSGNPAGRPKSRVREWFKGALSERSEALRPMTRGELAEIERSMFVLTDGELQAIIADPTAPCYLYTLAKAVRKDAERGRTETLDKLRERHYKEEEERHSALSAAPTLTIAAEEIAAEEARLQSLLKEAGRYTPELAAQISITAGVLVRWRKYQAVVTSEGYSNVTVEISREGNRREQLNPNEKLYLEYTEKAKSGLKALGLNFDSKDRKPQEADGFDDFMNKFAKDDATGD